MLQESINCSLQNLLTYPWIEDRVGKGLLSVHGGYYDFLDCTFEKWTLDFNESSIGKGDRFSVKDKTFWCWGICTLCQLTNWSPLLCRLCNVTSKYSNPFHFWLKPRSIYNRVSYVWTKPTYHSQELNVSFPGTLTALLTMSTLELDRGFSFRTVANGSPQQLYFRSPTAQHLRTRMVIRLSLRWNDVKDDNLLTLSSFKNKDDN